VVIGHDVKRCGGRQASARHIANFDILPSLDLRSPRKRKGRGFLPGPLSGPFGGFLLLTVYFTVHLAGDPGVSRP
jgi:hypothetical protein